MPEEFWRLTALYITVNSLGALSWAEKVDPEQIPLMQAQAKRMVVWYEHYRLYSPSWYR